MPSFTSTKGCYQTLLNQPPCWYGYLCSVHVRFDVLSSPAKLSLKATTECVDMLVRNDAPSAWSNIHVLIYILWLVQAFFHEIFMKFWSVLIAIWILERCTGQQMYNSRREAVGGTPTSKLLQCQALCSAIVCCLNAEVSVWFRHWQRQLVRLYTGLSLSLYLHKWCNLAVKVC